MLVLMHRRQSSHNPSPLLFWGSLLEIHSYREAFIRRFIYWSKEPGSSFTLYFLFEPHGPYLTLLNNELCRAHGKKN